MTRHSPIILSYGNIKSKHIKKMCQKNHLNVTFVDKPLVLQIPVKGTWELTPKKSLTVAILVRRSSDSLKNYGDILRNAKWRASCQHQFRPKLYQFFYMLMLLIENTIYMKLWNPIIWLLYHTLFMEHYRYDLLKRMGHCCGIDRDYRSFRWF